MVSPLVGLHVAISELGILMFLWAFVELLESSAKGVNRAKLATAIGTALFFLSWISGGYYYVETYGPMIKPVIKEGPQPWAHSIYMEAKEHIFLMLPFLGFICYSLIRKHEKDLSNGKNSKMRMALLYLLGLTVVIGVLMAVMGYIISSGYRTGLEAKL